MEVPTYYVQRGRNVLHLEVQKMVFQPVRVLRV